MSAKPEFVEQNDTGEFGFGLISALIVDDNAFDRRRLERTANETSLDFFLKEARNVQDFGRMLDRERFDVIYVDLNLAGDDGMKLLPIVRNHTVNHDAAMIMVAGESKAEVALQALRAGFSDYIEKDILSPASIERATINAVQKMRLSRAKGFAEEETRSVESQLKSFANSCAYEMRPMVTRMVRQVRQLKSETKPTGVTSATLFEIEKTCARIEEFFQDLGSMANAGNLVDVLGTSAPQAADAKPETSEAVVPRPAKKPSRLFSRTQPAGPAD